MFLTSIIQAVLGCLPIPDPSLGQEAMKIMRIAERVCKLIRQGYYDNFESSFCNTGLVAYVTRPDLMSHCPRFYSAVLNTLILAKCIAAHLWENSPYVSRQLKGIGPTFSTLLASAGKVNFMLLEESHPRDLERIMNKGPPAGNILRKQISLLPKYQLVITPVDERTITLQLDLLNQSYLTENTENLTAGEHHKSYIVVGDSSNELLLLTHFKDKDLISVYNGTIKHELKRKHDFEHKVFAHCISSSFVGIDTHTEYSFNNLENRFSRVPAIACDDTPFRRSKKQTCITDSFKGRKRKSAHDVDITHSKEKRKRDSNIIEKYKNLKDSFEFHIKETNHNVPQRGHIDNKMDSKPTIATNIIQNNIVSAEADSDQINTTSNVNYDDQDINCDEFIDNEQIDSILNDIEHEISVERSKMNNGTDQIYTTTLQSHNDKAKCNISPILTKMKNYNMMKMNSAKSTCTKRKTKPIINKVDNYNFIELLERNLELSDDEKMIEAPKYNGFAETIKCQINKYLQTTKNISKLPDTNLEQLIRETENTTDNPKICQKVLVPSDANHNANINVSLESCNRYEIKEILEPTQPSVQSSIPEHNKSIISTTKFTDTNKEPKIQNEFENNTGELHNKNNSQILNEIEINNKISTLALLNHTKNIKSADAIANVTTNIFCGNHLEEQNESKAYYTNEDNICEKDNMVISLMSNLKQTIQTKNIDIVTRIDNSSSEVNSASADCGAIYDANICSFQNLQNKTNDDKIPSTSNSVSSQGYAEEKEIYFNNYSFSAIKIDSCTKDSIRILRKVRVALNISEIISREKKDPRMNVYKEKQNFDEDERNECIELFKPILSHNELATNDLTTTSNNKIDTSVYSDEMGIRNHSSNTHDYTNVESIPLNQIIDETISLAEQDNTNDNKDINVDNKYCSKEINQTTALRVQDNKDLKLFTGEASVCYDEPTVRELTPKSEDNKLKSILQKYSKILGKDPPKTMTPVRLNTGSSTSNKNFAEDKPVRPFKISEINRLQAPLPKSLINDKPVCIDSLPKIKEHIDTPENISQEQKQLNFYNNIKNSIEVPEYQYSNLETFHIPNDVDLEPCKDFNIDHSMFDPKALLQCVINNDNDNDKIIPPPPQFCDESNYSPQNIHEISMTKDQNHQWYTDFEDDNNSVVDYKNNFNESIFDDIYAAELTPSKEIETWTLSREDSWETPEVNSAKTFTIMHKNTPPTYDGTALNSLLPRRARLDKFKFNQKNKLKIRN